LLIFGNDRASPRLFVAQARTAAFKLQNAAPFTRFSQMGFAACVGDRMHGTECLCASLAFPLPSNRGTDGDQFHDD
jgi:hypothetical protein